MRVFKFGGASIRNAEAVKHIAELIQPHLEEKSPLVIVVSAMGKTTNNLETLLSEYLKGDTAWETTFNELKSYHEEIVKALFPDPEATVYLILEKLFFQLRERLLQPEPNYDKKYSQIISFGELISSNIVARYLQFLYANCLWIDARKVIQTNEQWREGQIDWKWSERIMKNELVPILEKFFVVTQGFLGGTIGGQTTTLGREGSDFSAAVFAYCLKADSVTIWKDVSGILNGDPKQFTEAQLFSQLSYIEAAEMTYYGASVIHPKTIRPLAEKDIPLYVRSFVEPAAKGTMIGNCDTTPAQPAFITKKNQALVTFKKSDLSSISQREMVDIINGAARLNLKINLMQNAASEFSFSTNYDAHALERLQKESRLVNQFAIEVETGLQILT
ncbi:MAG: aspartate kinase, partial [Bacteroidota bacterium]